MNFPRDYHWKKRMNVSNLNNFNKNSTTNLYQLPNFITAKGVVRIEQYQYSEENILGAGYSSKVYLGHLTEDVRQNFAIKVVDKRKLSKDKENISLIKQQMEIHRHLDHPNIVKCHQIIQRPNHYYFILDYCPQGTLDSFIKKQEKLTETTTVTIMEQIIEGYRYLIQHQILHRDLKPPNILKSGNTWKICDFGFSIKGKKNLVGQINVGTPAYMAPEALQRTYYSPKTDFFSLGIICYEMLFGMTPWKHENQKVLLQMMQQQKINQQHLSLIQNQNLLLFIIKCCQPFERKRMSLQEFSQYSFKKKEELTSPSLKYLQNRNDFLTSRPSCKSICFVRDYSISTASCPTQNSSYSTVRGMKKQTILELFNGNNSVIERELYICQILNALIKNFHILSLDDSQKELYLTVLSKHVGYIVRRIKHTKLNYLALKRWEQYCQSQQYVKLATQATSIYEKMDSFLKNQMKRKSIVTMRIVNKKYDQLTYDKHLTFRCVASLKEFAVETMKNMLKMLQQKKRVEIERAPEIIQMLFYWNKYYVYIKNICVSSQQSRAIAINQDYKDRHNISEDFKKSNLAFEDFEFLKEEISNIQV